MLLSDIALFQSFSEKEIEALLFDLGAERKTYTGGQAVCRAGEPVTAVGLVLSGSVMIQSDDVWGNRSILDKIGPGQVFAETYACIPGEPLMVDVAAQGSVEILFLHTAPLFLDCPETCESHARLLRNFLAVTARKNLNLSRRIFHTASKTIRGRLLSYLSYQARRQGSRRFQIPFNRQELADYLGVDRSAMSNELSKMRRDGLVDCHKNDFVLKNLD